MWCVAPSGHHKRGPHPITRMDIDWTRDTACWASPLMCVLHLLLNERIRELMRYQHQTSPTLASFIAVTNVFVIHSADQGRRSTVATVRHMYSVHETLATTGVVTR